MGGQALYGLYDIEGILRYVGGDREDCLEYAQLFELTSVECCLIALSGSESNELGITHQGEVHPAMSSN